MLKNTISIYILIFLISFFSGCNNAMTNYEKNLYLENKLKKLSIPIKKYLPNSEVKLVESHNYKLNETMKTYVGDNMIKIKKIHYLIHEPVGFYPKKHFTIENKYTTINFSPNDLLHIDGTTTIENIKYLILTKDFIKGKILYDTNKNKIHNQLISSEYNILSKDVYIVDPSDIELYSQPINERSRIIKDKPYVNYEILFSGITKDTIRFQYREYTYDNLIKHAFSQDLTYPINTKIIRFKNLVIKIKNIGLDFIIYKIVKD